ncbi:MAG TPA: serine hydrolase domain-containing protein [Bacteroidota bacterium]|nr:serine hydrolase domain-containing protein [Bacteroidota bacterium]
MKRLLFAVFLLFFPSLEGVSQNQRISDNPELQANIRLMEQWVQSQLAYRGLPGLSIGIVYDQELVYARGFGYSNLADSVVTSSQTIYRIASLTKTFTATAIMQLRDQGKLRLDDPVEEYLPWFRVKTRFPDQPKVTIRQLLTHTSGLPREAAYPYWTDNKFPSRTEMIKGLENQEMIFFPEDRVKYSNLGIAIAGEIVAEVAGMPYSEYVEKNILEPLGMKSTTVYFQDSQSKRLAVGYSRKLDDGSRNVMPFTNARALVAAANMSSTIEDMAKFASLQFRERQIVFGDQILKGSAIREMRRVQWLNPDWKSGYGLGFATWRENDRTVVGHSGWVAGFRSHFSFLPAEKIAVIVLTNSDDGDPGFFASHVMAIMLPPIQRATAKSVDVSIPDPEWSAYVGSYQDAWWFETQVFILNGRLMMYDHSYPPEENPRANLVELTPLGQRTFRMTGENGNGELVIFEMEDNAVVRVKVGENYLHPKK